MDSIRTDICMKFLWYDFKYVSVRNGAPKQRESGEWKDTLKERDKHSERKVSSTDSANLWGFESQYDVKCILFFNLSFLGGFNLRDAHFSAKGLERWLFVMRSER